MNSLLTIRHSVNEHAYKKPYKVNHVGGRFHVTCSKKKCNSVVNVCGNLCKLGERGCIGCSCFWNIQGDSRRSVPHITFAVRCGAAIRDDVGFKETQLGVHTVDDKLGRLENEDALGRRTPLSF